MPIVASDTRDPGFEPSNRQFYLGTVYSTENAKISNKEAWNGSSLGIAE